MCLKAIIVGNAHVGKSSVQQRFAVGTFSELRDSTVGVDFSCRRLSLNGTQVKICIWDTAGQEKFRSITRVYFRHAAVCVMVYDITDRDSFASIRDWAIDAKNNAPDSIILVLIGNKKDKEKRRTVSPAEGQALAEELEVTFFETSAKTGENIEEVFTAVTSVALARALCSHEFQSLSVQSRQECC